MTTETLTLSQFLEARIAEDERRAAIYDGEFTPHVLATCKAHRAIVERYELAKSEAAVAWNDYSDWVEGKAPVTRPELSIPDPDKVVAGLEFPLRALASVYADHPSFDPRWAL